MEFGTADGVMSEPATEMRMMECAVRAMSQRALLLHYWKSRSQVYKYAPMEGLGFRVALFLIESTMIRMVLTKLEYLVLQANHNL